MIDGLVIGIVRHRNRTILNVAKFPEASTFCVDVLEQELRSAQSILLPLHSRVHVGENLVTLCVDGYHIDVPMLSGIHDEDDMRLYAGPVPIERVPDTQDTQEEFH